MSGTRFAAGGRHADLFVAVVVDLRTRRSVAVIANSMHGAPARRSSISKPLPACANGSS
ncbi:hypothetical protein [Micromonospora sediminicola]|uniref:hypothetical protein n=1 Tax=Micromonospora sediminicola TaxID=946078 RepID=UPI0037B6B0DF